MIELDVIYSESEYLIGLYQAELDNFELKLNWTGFCLSLEL